MLTPAIGLVAEPADEIEVDQEIQRLEGAMPIAIGAAMASTCRETGPWVRSLVRRWELRSGDGGNGTRELAGGRDASLATRRSSRSSRAGRCRCPRAELPATHSLSR